MDIKLRDVIWEVTSKCNRNCEYCGSKDTLNQKDEPKPKDTIKIAERIAEYVQGPVTLSGGEPGCLSQGTIKKIQDVFEGKDLRAITNGKLFETCTADQIVQFSTIGLSLNHPADYGGGLSALAATVGGEAEAAKIFEMGITAITNFGSHNIWEFDDISHFVEQFAAWQVQLTISDEFGLPPEGIIHLWEKLTQIAPHKLIIADNLQTAHVCSAGLWSCGVTYKGDVISCLSERAYCTEPRVYGNLLENTFEEIWENQFKEIRFGEGRKTCRACFRYPHCEPSTQQQEAQDTEERQDGVRGVLLPPRTEGPSRGGPLRSSPMYPTPSSPGSSMVMMYGVLPAGTGSDPSWDMNMLVHGNSNTGDGVLSSGLMNSHNLPIRQVNDDGDSLSLGSAQMSEITDALRDIRGINGVPFTTRSNSDEAQSETNEEEDTGATRSNSDDIPF